MHKFTLKNDDALEVLRCLETGSVQMVLTDIPYGEVSQVSSGLRRLDRGDADACNFEISTLVGELTRVCSGSIYIFCGTMQISGIVANLKERGLTTRVGVWEKTNPSPMNGTRLWLSGLEFCVFARKPGATFNEHCKKAIWQAPSGRGKVHPTEKPVGLMQRLILASSNPGDTILDPFMGSGTTGVAAKAAGRGFIGVELNLEYFQLASNRIAGKSEIKTAT